MEDDKLKGAIVVSFHNSVHSLEKLLAALVIFGTGGYDIVVVDNNSDTPEAIEYLNWLQDPENTKWDFKCNLTVLRTEPSSYETGSLITALRNTDYNEFLLLQDSMCPISSDWMQEFQDKRAICDVVSYCAFQPVFLACSEEHKAYIYQVCGRDAKIPLSGIFGSCILVTRKILEDLEEKGYFKPENLPSKKLHSESWERIWAIALHNEGYRVQALIPNFDVNQIVNTHPRLRKDFMHRQ